MHSITDLNISRLDEIRQAVGTWNVANDSRSFTVTVAKYFRPSGAVEFGGYFECTSPCGGGDACGDFFHTQDEALDDLLRRVAEFIPPIAAE